MRAPCFALKLGLFLLIAGALAGQALFVKPVKVLGDPNFIGTAANPLLSDSIGPNVVEGREVNQPLGVALDTSVSPPIVYIADTGNNRVLGFQYSTQLTAGASADLILGQPDRFTNLAEGPGTSLSTGLRAPTGLAVDGAGNLYVADSGNNRVLRYAKPFAQPAGYQFPDLIIGQASFAGGTGDSGGVKATTLLLSGGSFIPHTGLAFDSSGNLWVTDTGNNRVLRFPVSVLVPNQNGPLADTAVGQADLVSSVAAKSRITKTGLLNPIGLAFDSAGNMLVADGLARVVEYAAGTLTTNATAGRILGVALPTASQPNPPPISAISVGSVTSVIATTSNVIVVDNGNNRVLVFPPVSQWPVESSQFSPGATAVIGQSSFSNSTANQGGQPSSSTVNSPVDLAAAGGELYVVDSGNHRVLVFPSSPAGPSAAASRVIGQLDFPYNAPNLVEGREFFTAGQLTSASGSAVLDLSATPPHLYVADTQNNRILGFNDFTHAITGQKADLVIGQPDFLHSTVNYPSNVPTTPNQQGLSGPSSLAVDSAGNLYVADTFNSRILRFPAPFASNTANLESADLVIGQPDFFSIVPDATAHTMSAPISLAFTKDGANAAVTSSGYLLAADANHSRVLLFQKPFSSGMNASSVIGQPSFTSTSSASLPASLSAPRGVAVDPQDRILVADTGNSRVQVFGAVQSLPAFLPEPSFSLTAGLNSPVAIGMASNGQFWVADAGQSQLLHFPSIDQLPLTNYKSDASQPVISPRSAFVDPFNNLLVADGINRILYFAPGLGVVNAANYIAGRPLAPGAFASVFPAVSSNVIAAGTGTAASFPLPTTIADTQVLVNNNPSALFFVSPGQINLPLSMSLPTGGTVSLEILRPSTGQIYGGAEVAMSSASPGLFTTGGTGTGQVAAINVTDGSINSATNPVVRGSYISLFGTGQGFVSNAPPDGQASTTAVPTAVHPQILLGNGATAAYVPDANIQYSGLAPSLAGVWQINFQVPATATAGNNVPITVLMNSIPSNNASITTTISVK